MTVFYTFLTNFALMKQLRRALSFLLLAAATACSGGKDEPSAEVLCLSLAEGRRPGTPSWDIGTRVKMIDGSGAEYILRRQDDGLYSGEALAGTAPAPFLVIPESGVSTGGNAPASVDVHFPAVQEAAPGAVPSGSVFYAGFGHSRDITLEPLFSGLVLNLETPAIQAVTLVPQCGEKLPLGLRFGMEDGRMTPTEYGSRIRLETISGAGEAVLALPPLSLENGFMLIVETAEGLSRELLFPSPLQLAPGEFAAVDVSLGEEPDPESGEGLRLLYIDTPGGTGITSKDKWTEDCTFTLVGGSGKVYYQSSGVSVKGRGNTTWWSYPKKPYSVRLPEKADLIGTGGDRRWVLLANWMDRTLLRNDVAFEIARHTSLEWTPSGEFVELYLNGQHMGNYWLGEKIKTGESRLKADFLIEMDTYFDAAWRFQSSYGRRVNSRATGMPIGVKEPDDDEMTEALFSQLKDLVGAAEESLYESSVDWKEKIDASSFADWYLVHELTGNMEPNHPKSCYFYFRDGKMYAGPVWDFDWYTFQPGSAGLLIPRCIYYEKLLSDSYFVSLLKSRWSVLKENIADIPDYIAARAGLIRESESVNWSMWPCSPGSSVNGDESMSFDGAVSRLSQAFTARVSALDKAIDNL